MTSDTEKCGLVYRWPLGGGEDIAPVNNVAADPKASFEMDGSEQTAVIMRYGRWPDAIYHTHPGGRFDLSDRDRASLPPHLDLLLGVPDGRVGMWRAGKLIKVWEPKRFAVELNRNDMWVGLYRGEHYDFVCLVPCVAIRVRRNKEPRRARRRVRKMLWPR